jgi:aspartate ammonia-lyase
MTDFRTETDSLGTKQLPREAIWGIHTARALENFPITGVPLAHRAGSANSDRGIGGVSA